MAQKKFIIDGGFQVNDDSIIEANLEMAGNILPTVDSDGVTGYDLGSPTLKWRDLYLSQGSLYIDGQKVLESDSGTIVVQADPDQSLTTKVSGTGVLTFQSPTVIAMAGTLQMSAGKKITDQAGSAVGFGDKIDMDSNQIINVGAPTADAHAATKLYVDQLVGNIATDAITEGDSEIEIADLGTGTVGITVDGGQRFALSAASLAMTVPVTVNGVELADVNEVSAAEAAAVATAAADATSKVAAEASTREAADLALSGRLDVIEGADSVEGSVAKAEADAKAYTDTREAAITTAYQAYADTAEADAISTAAADASDKANAAQAAATTASNAYTDAREAAITTAYQAYADQAEVDAKSYTDTKISEVVDAAPGTLDTLNELAAALGDDANFSTTITNTLATKAAITYVDAADSALDVRVTQNEGDIAQHETDITANTANIATNTANIATNSSDIADNAAAIAALATSSQAYADTAEADAVTAAAAYTDGEVSTEATARAAADTALSGRLDTLEGDATTAGSVAKALADAKSYADTAESDAVSTAAADATSKANAAQSAAEATAAADATSKANAAQSAAEATAAADATSKVSAEASTRAAADTALSGRLDVIEGADTVEGSVAKALKDAKAYADQAEADAESAAAADATSKANAAQSAAAADATSKANAAQSAAEATASADATSKANAAQSAAEATASADATSKANAAEAAAVATAAADATSKASAAQSAAATDATSKANAAEADAKAYADTLDSAIRSSNQALASDGNALTVSNDTITLRKGDGSTESVSISDANTWRPVVDGLTSTSTSSSLTAKQGKVLKDLVDTKATPADITTAINNLVDGAPAALNTLNELAAAIGDNASYASSITTALGNKVSTGSSEYIKGATVSNDTITFTRGDNTTFSVTTSDANSNTYVTGAAFNTSNGVLTLTRNSGSVTVDLDGRYQAAGSYAASGRVITAGNGLTGGGNLTANRTIHVGGGNGISVSADGVAMSGSYTGSFTATGDITAYSDDSLKTNVEVIDGALGKVEAIRGVTFERIEDGSVSTGVIAQELEAVLPEAVKTDEDGLKHVAYGNITGLLIEAVKELSAQVAELKKK